ncbi:MAG: type I-U CRISPR-associated RAMP protein Csb1/Cas7u [Chloroflexota bacterium]|nr:type I-U CRISPR-associated RAMP protein Csb1/Cas7u [Chloroflexota bacterium]
MAKQITLESLLAACADDSFDDGIRIDTELEPLSGPGGTVKPAVYEGGTYQMDRRWASPADEEPTPVIVIDNVPSQANRLEEAIRRHRSSVKVPELVLDLAGVGSLPVHLPRRLSSLEFPHRNADAYLRDARLGDDDFSRTELGREIFGATPQTCGPLMAWFPQALLYGFWQSHLGKKRQNTKHARSWVSEIVGWNPAATETRVLGLKGDALNLSTDETVTSNPDDRMEWTIGTGAKVEGGKKDRLSEMGHGQVPFMGDEATAAAVSFARVTQRVTLSFAQLRRISLGSSHSAEADPAARALLVALGLHAHQLAFGRGFALRSGAELRPGVVQPTWLGPNGDEPCALGDVEESLARLRSAAIHASSVGVRMDGWDREPVMLTPKENLSKAIRATWPDLHD